MKNYSPFDIVSLVAKDQIWIPRNKITHHYIKCIFDDRRSDEISWRSHYNSDERYEAEFIGNYNKDGKPHGLARIITDKGFLYEDNFKYGKAHRWIRKIDNRGGIYYFDDALDKF